MDTGRAETDLRSPPPPLRIAHDWRQRTRGRTFEIITAAHCFRDPSPTFGAGHTIASSSGRLIPRMVPTVRGVPRRPDLVRGVPVRTILSGGCQRFSSGPRAKTHHGPLICDLKFDYR